MEVSRKTKPRESKTAPVKTKETDIVRCILNYLSHRKVLAWRMPVQASLHSKNGDITFRRSPITGFPDIAALHRGTFIALEVKGPKGKVAAHQQVWIDKLNKHGAIAGVVCSLDEVIELIDEIEKQLREGQKCMSSVDCVDLDVDCCMKE